jgi:hypothetical protein
MKTSAFQRVECASLFLSAADPGDPGDPADPEALRTVSDMEVPTSGLRDGKNWYQVTENDRK